MEDKERIITKRASKLKFTISNAFGGVGKIEIIIIVINFFITALLFSFLAKYLIIASILITIFIWLVGLFLIFPTKTGTKLYYVLWIGIKYIFAKKENTNILEISNILEIKNNMIVFPDKKAFVFRIEATDISLANQAERDVPIFKLASIFKTLDFNFEISKIQIPYNFKNQVDFLKKIINSEKRDVVKKQLLNWENNYSELELNIDNLKTVYYLILYGDEFENINKKIRFVINELDNHIKFLKASFEETSLLAQRNAIPTNEIVENANKIKQYSDYIVIDNSKFCSYVTISQYPVLVPDTWLSFLSNLENVNVNIKIHHISEQESLKLLDKAINRAEIQTTKKTSEEIKFQTYLDHFVELMNLVQNGGETLKMVSIIFTCFAESKNKLEDVKNKLLNEMVKKGFVPDELKFQQLKIYNFIWNSNLKNTDELWQEISTTSLAAAYPFLPEPLNDKNGVFLGTNEINEPLFFDIKHRDSNRNSSNACFFGFIGSGKTSHVKKQLNWLYCNNTKIYIIDPEREYHQLARYYGGEIIPIGKLKNSRINPLEIFSSDLNEHISLIEQWFKILYPALTDNDLSLLQQNLFQLYKNFKITTLTELETLKPTDYPTLSDFFEIIDKKESKKIEKSILYNILWKLAKGADGYLWNGHTTLSLKNDLIVFDTHEISSNKNRQNAQLFLMLAFLDRVVKDNKAKNETLPVDKRQWVCIAIDEAHLLINENSILALNFLFEMTKRIRKYNGILFIITQNINDFMGNENIKTQAQGIINNCLYQFVHNLAASDLNDYDDLISASGRLNEFQKQWITTAQTGMCLMSVGSNKKYDLKIELTQNEIEIFG